MVTFDRTKWLRWATAAVTAVSLSLAGCASSASRPGPTRVPQPRGAYVRVPFPPPPARAEFVSLAPSPVAVWISGEWDYRFGRWAWTYGRWVIPPRRAKGHARWSLVRDARGELWFAPGAWRDERGEVVDPPEPLATGNARDLSVLEEDGTHQVVGPNRPPPPPEPRR